MSASDAPAASRIAPISVPPPALRVRELITPEGVDLRLVLAEASERAAAVLLDVVFIALALVAMSIVALAVAVVTKVVGAAEVIGAIWLLGSFFLRNFYFMAFELAPRAATPGKRMLGLRVAMRDGRPLTADAIFARNAMRELEIFLPLTFLAGAAAGVDAWIKIAGIVWCGVFVFFPLWNRDRLRVGDFVGGTWVIRNPKRILDVDLAAAPSVGAPIFTRQALEAYGIKELNVLEDVLRSKDAASFAAVANRIRKKIDMKTTMPDEQFLAAYYAALRRHLESRLLFGRRRRDKFDAP